MADAAEFRRQNLLADLKILNRDLARNEWPPLVSDEAAAVCPLEELPALLAATRRRLKHMAEAER
ncbi:MAG TPA: hypothetical protein VGH66_03275 [Acidimicrobiales bacterium]|jgi:hypothetical protein